MSGWQSRLKPKELTSHPKCQLQIDYKSHPELYTWLLLKSRETNHSMSAIVRAILYEAFEADGGLANADKTGLRATQD